MATSELIALILQYGLKYGPSVIATISGWFSGNPGMPTADQWAALIAQCNTTAKQQLLDVFKAKGIDPNSDTGKALLALVPA